MEQMYTYIMKEMNYQGINLLSLSYSISVFINSDSIFFYQTL